jgi:hypothetical protein
MRFGEFEKRVIDAFDFEKKCAYVTLRPHGTQSCVSLTENDLAIIAKYKHSAIPMRFMYRKMQNGHLLMAPDFDAYERAVKAATIQIKELKCL